METQWMTCQSCKRIRIANNVNICDDCQLGKGFHLNFGDPEWKDILASEDQNYLIDDEPVYDG